MGRTKPARSPSPESLRELVEQASELAGEETLVELPDTEIEDGAASGHGRRNFERFDVTANPIHVSIRDEHRSTLGTGLVENASVTGMWVNTENPLKFRDLVRVEITILDGVRMEFAGRVVRSADNGFALHLSTSDEDWRFRAQFIELARRGSGVAPRVNIRRTDEEDLANFQKREEQLRHLRRIWETASKDIESEPMHQEFIQECIRIKRLEFALERYRELKVIRPDLELVDRYIQQLGTVLSFYNLQDREKRNRRVATRGVMVALVIALLVAVTVLSGATW